MPRVQPSMNGLIPANPPSPNPICLFHPVFNPVGPLPAPTPQPALQPCWTLTNLVMMWPCDAPHREPDAIKDTFVIRTCTRAHNDTKESACKLTNQSHPKRSYIYCRESLTGVCLCVFAVLLAVTSLVVNRVLHHILLWSNIMSGDKDKAMGCKQSDLIERGLIHRIA